jgi:hypothetical protein
MPSQSSVTTAKKMLVKIKKNIIAYIETFKDKVNKDYLDFLSSVVVLPDSSVSLIVSAQNDSGGFEPVEITFSCPTKIELKFMGLLFNKAIVEIIFPQTIIGEMFVLPTVKVSIPTYKPWFGNVGLAWEGLTGVKNKIGFYPYENSQKMEADIKGYFNDNIVDPLCDFLNNFKTPCSLNLKKNLAKFLTKKDTLKFLKYESVFRKKKFNVIGVPIRSEYDSTQNQSFVSFSFYSIGNGNEWLPVSKILLEFLTYFSEATSYFNSSGELLSEDELEAMLMERNESSGKPKPSKRKTADRIERDDNWDPFKKVEALKRDEFGFQMDKRSAEFGTKDVEVARKSVIQSGSEQMRKILEKERNQEGPEPQDVSRWSSASQWYNDLQGKQFIVTGGGSDLPFKDRGELMLLKGCNPPFILRFARDQIRIKNSMLGSEIQKLMFKFYKMGYLRLK